MRARDVESATGLSAAFGIQPTLCGKPLLARLTAAVSYVPAAFIAWQRRKAFRPIGAVLMDYSPATSRGMANYILRRVLSAASEYGRLRMSDSLITAICLFLLACWLYEHILRRITVDWDNDWDTRKCNGFEIYWWDRAHRSGAELITVNWPWAIWRRLAKLYKYLSGLIKHLKTRRAGED